MYKITLTNVRGDKPISIQVVARSRDAAIKKAQHLLSDELCTYYKIECVNGTLKIYDEKGLQYKSLEVTENEETDRRQALQHCSSAEDRIWRR